MRDQMETQDQGDVRPSFQGLGVIVGSLPFIRVGMIWMINAAYSRTSSPTSALMVAGCAADVDGHRPRQSWPPRLSISEI